MIEQRSPQPPIPLTFLRSRNRAGGYAVMLLVGASMLSLLFFLTQFLQDVLHYSPLRAGVSYVPVPVMVASTSYVVSRTVKRVGVRPFITAGPQLVACGFFWASFLHASSSYPHVFGPLVVFGVGMGLSFVPLTLNAVSGVRDNEQGLASSLLNTSQQIGGSLGLALLVTVAATARRRDLSVLATRTASGVVSTRHDQLVASVQGFHDALLVGALLAAGAFLVSVLVVRPPAAPTTSPTSRGIEPADSLVAP